MPGMKNFWHYPQIIDFEFLLRIDEQEDDASLSKRDREIFLDAGGEKIRPGNRRELLRIWLTERLAALYPAAEIPSPGQLFTSGRQLTNALLLFFGILAGFGAGFSFFAYTGDTPVNVFHFLLFFVGSQLVLTLLLLAGLALRATKLKAATPTVYDWLLRPFLLKMTDFLLQKAQTKFSARHRLAINRTLGMVRGHNTMYGGLFYWLLFSRAQLFGIFFNCGLLAAILLKLLTSDLAFGWQSTLPFTSEAIHNFVSIAAWPWSWLTGPELATPTLAQIEGSRIILKEGIRNLATPNLVAWWPFLVFSVLTYGFVVRLLLFCVGKWRERASFHDLRFDTPACLAIVRRMTTPQLSTQAPDISRVQLEKAVPDAPPRQNLASATPTPRIALIAADIVEAWPNPRLNDVLQPLQMQVVQQHPFMADYDADQTLLLTLAARDWQPDEGLFLLMEGWMPPLIDSLSFIRQLRELLPANMIITVGLVGRPQHNATAALSQQDLEIWRNKLAGLGDPYLEIYPLTPGDTADDS